MFAAARVEGQSMEDMVMKGWQWVELDYGLFPFGCGLAGSPLKPNSEVKTD